jgi:hypothetical protein
VLGARVIPGIPADRARIRTTLSYQFTPSFSAGIEYNPLADNVEPIANWRLWDETDERPALILGTSSARIGSSKGTSYNMTFVKSVEAWTDLPIAPYVGLSYDDYEDKTSVIGGLSIAWAEDWNSLHLWDGYNFHTVIDRTLQDHSIGLVIAQQDEEWYAGLSWSWSIPAP